MKMDGYHRLTAYLLKRGEPKFTLTFNQIEEIVGRTFSRIANDPQYWSNREDPRKRYPPNRAAREAGYKTSLVKRSNIVIFTKAPDAEIVAKEK